MISVMICDSPMSCSIKSFDSTKSCDSFSSWESFSSCESTSSCESFLRFESFTRSISHSLISLTESETNSYSEITYPNCKICDNSVKIDKNRYISCEDNKCFYHKSCIKHHYQYLYHSSQIFKEVNYKTYHKCQCGKKIKLHKNKKYIIKKIIKYCSPLLLMLVVI